ncbi:hypothetical protein [Anatilimnocola floriformis]|uniref:hypothetical protein n=1 Tax=Anatilimnocola floriformis TaxID=2948575 RepID=UPI0020C354A8|nr:hypothetical protein [Anatilimnocola floriformis]
MARQESDREDLLREATALVQRAEFQLPDEPEPVVAGFRRDGSFSLFFGGERVVQLNSAGQLRRGYFDGKLLKADRGRLVWMTRERTADAVVLHSRELQPNEVEQTLTLATELIERLSSALQQGAFTLVGQIPEGGNIGQQILVWRSTLPLPLQIAAAPNAR